MENLTLSSLRQENTKENRNKMSAVNLAALTYLQGEQETAEFSSKAGQSDSDISFMNNVQERRKKGISGFFSNKFNCNKSIFFVLLFIFITFYKYNIKNSIVQHPNSIKLLTKRKFRVVA